MAKSKKDQAQPDAPKYYKVTKPSGWFTAYLTDQQVADFKDLEGYTVEEVDSPVEE